MYSPSKIFKEFKMGLWTHIIKVEGCGNVTSLSNTLAFPFWMLEFSEKKNEKIRKENLDTDHFFLLGFLLQ